MKVCILTHSFPRFAGDTATPFMENLATAISSLGEEVYVLTPFDSQMNTKRKNKVNIITYKYIFPEKLHILGYARSFKYGKSLSFLTYILSPFLYLFGIIALCRLVRKERIDIISAHWVIPNGFIARVVQFITNVPYTVTIPGADVRLGGANELFRRMFGFAVSGADYVISDSSHYIDQFNNLGFEHPKIQIIRYGVNTNVFKPVRKDETLLKYLGLKNSDKVVLAVGRFVVQKGFIYLVKAFVDITRKIPDAKLIIIGDGYEKQNLINEAKNLQIEDQLIFPGTIGYDKLIDYYNLADVFVMPSIKDIEGNVDASPVAMMEAMACGIPVVATKFSGDKDLIIDGRSGFLVKEKDNKEIANAVIQLLQNDTEKTKERVREIATNNFSINQTANKYITIFKEILGG